MFGVGMAIAGEMAVEMEVVERCSILLGCRRILEHVPSVVMHVSIEMWLSSYWSGSGWV